MKGGSLCALAIAEYAVSRTEHGWISTLWLVLSILSLATYWLAVLADWINKS